MSLTGKGGGGQLWRETETANLTKIADKREYSKPAFKALRSKCRSFDSIAEAFVLPDICHCGHQIGDHDSEGCELCGHDGGFIP